MKNTLLAAVCGLTVLCSGAVNATERMYAIVSGGYTQADFADSSVDGISYKFAVGHQFHPQWYFEAGYQRIADETINDNSLDPSEVLEGDALFVSVLGKAGSRQGELFYRLGVMRADMQGYRANTQCDEVCATVYETNPYNDGVYAGVIGIGYDWYIGLNSMLRFEVEHIAGENSLQVNAAYIGYRYNFN